MRDNVFGFFGGGGGTVSPQVTAVDGEDLIVTGPATMLGFSYSIAGADFVWVPWSGSAYTIPGSAGQQVEIAVTPASKSYAPSADYVAAQTAYFGQQTPANLGGFRPFDRLGLPVALTGTVQAIDTLAATWAIVGGDLVRTAGTQASDHGKRLRVATATGKSVVITLDTMTYTGEAVATAAHLATLMATASRVQDKAHILRCRDYTVGAVGWAGSTGAGASLGAERTDVRRPILNGRIALNASNFTLSDVAVYFPATEETWNASDPNAILNTLLGTGSATTGVTVSNVEVYSNFGKSGDGDWAKGYFVGLSVAGSGNTIRDCILRNLWDGMLVTGSNHLIERNKLSWLWGDGIRLTVASNIHLRGNSELGKCGWGSVIHGDIVQFITGPISNILIEGHVYAPGPVRSQRPGIEFVDAPNLAKYYSTAVSLVMDKATHLGNQLQVTAAVTITLPPSSTLAVDDAVLLRANMSSSINATIACATGDFFDDGAASRLMAGGAGWILRWTGSRWTRVHAGFRINQVLVTQSMQVPAYYKGHELLVDTSDGPKTITLPASPVSGADNGKGDAVAVTQHAISGGSPLTVVPPAGSLMRMADASGNVSSEYVSSVVINDGFQGKKFIYSTGGEWIVHPMKVYTQGAMNNATGFTGYVVFAGCILPVGTPQGIGLGGTYFAGTDAVVVTHTALPSSFPKVENTRDGKLDTADGAVTATGTATAAFDSVPNPVLARSLVNAISGTPYADDYTVLTVTGAAALAGDDSKITAVMQGHPNNWPTTIAEAIDMARLKAGYRTGEYFGPHAYWDFETQTRRAAPPLSASDVLSVYSGDNYVTVEFDAPLLKGTGSVEIYNVTDSATVETVNMTATTLRGNKLIIPTTAAFTLDGDTYSVRIPAGAVRSIWQSALPAVTGDGLSFTPIAPNHPVITKVADKAINTAHTVGEGDTWTLDPAKSYLAIVFMRPNTGSDASGQVSFTIGAPGRSSGGTPVTDLYRFVTNAHQWVFRIDPGEWGTDPVTLRYTSTVNVNMSDIVLLELGANRGFGGYVSHGVGSGSGTTDRPVTLAGNTRYSTLVMTATGNQVGMMSVSPNQAAANPMTAIVAPADPGVMEVAGWTLPVGGAGGSVTALYRTTDSNATAGFMIEILAE